LLPAQALQLSKWLPCKNRGGATTAVIALVDETRTFKERAGGPDSGWSGSPAAFATTGLERKPVLANAFSICHFISNDCS